MMSDTPIFVCHANTSWPASIAIIEGQPGCLPASNIAEATKREKYILPAFETRSLGV